MDVHVHSNPRLHYGHNGYHQAPHTKDDGLQFLSMEEKECILFFEETIDSLEEGLEDDGTGLSSDRRLPVGGPPTTSSSAGHSAPATTVAPNMREHDIIDLVRSTPDMPDFQSLAVTPQSHFEMKPRRDPAQSAYEEGSHQPPPGSIPTPVIIASKIAEHQGGTSGGTSALPSVLIQQRGNLEPPHSPTTRHGPPTQTKPHRLPDNINMMMGSRDLSPQAIATAAVSMQERRSQMLANLPSSAHPLEGGEPACVRNTPSRSVSFTDPAPDKSRMEALSMLGLTQGRAGSSTDTAYNSAHNPSISPNTTISQKNSSPYKVSSSSETASNTSHIYNNAVNNTSISPNTTVSQRNNSAYKVSSSAEMPSNTARTYNSTANNVNTSPKNTVSQKKNSIPTVTPSTPSSYEAKSECFTSSFNSYGGKSSVFTPAAVTNHDKKSVPQSPISAEVTQIDLNSYGGKTIMLNPTASFKAESFPSPSSPPAKAEPADNHINSYGGRSTVIHPPTQTDQPACRPRSHSNSPSNTITSTTQRNDLPSPTGAKSRIFPPAKADSLHYSSSVRDEAHPDLHSHESKSKAVTDPVFNPAGRSRATSMPPATAPRPQRTSGSLRPRPDPVPPEILHKSPLKSFRTQGITVQFSGKGKTDEARRDALRKLGLLKDTS